jgi:hypothetical protein
MPGNRNHGKQRMYLLPSTQHRSIGHAAIKPDHVRKHYNTYITFCPAFRKVFVVNRRLNDIIPIGGSIFWVKERGYG